MSVVTVTILNENTPMDPGWDLVEIDIVHEINKIPYALVKLIDGEPARQEFPVSSAAFFLPGNEIEIKARYEEDATTETTLFKGIVTSHRVEADEGASFLSLELKDKAIRMTQGRLNAVYREQTDQVIIQNIFELAGLEVVNSAETPVTHRELVQYYCTDWDFAMARIEANGLWLLLDQGQVRVVDPTASQPDVSEHRFAYGTDPIYRLDLELNGEGQAESVGSQSWNIAEQAVSSVALAGDFQPGPGDQSGAALAAKVGVERITQLSQALLLPEELQAWSDARLRKSRLARVRGTFTVEGNGAIQLLDTAVIGGISGRFNGTAVITGVRHRIFEQGWFTDVQLGLGDQWFVERHPVSDVSAAGLLPPIHGLQVGVVGTFENDPDGHFRVQVRIPAFGEEAGPIWARLASPEAGNNRGSFFRPEPGDEVVIGFFNDDPRQAVVLGALYSQAQPPPEAIGGLDENNFIKGIFSREGVQLKIDDEKRQLQLVTSDSQSVTLDEDGKFIELKDVNGNTVTMDAQGITMKSAKDFVIEASDTVTIKGKKVDVK